MDRSAVWWLGFTFEIPGHSTMNSWPLKRSVGMEDGNVCTNYGEKVKKAWDRWQMPRQERQHERECQFVKPIHVAGGSSNV